MTPKEAFKDIMHELRQRHMDMYADCDKEIVGLIIDEMNKRENIVDQALTELEELKQRDTPMKWIDVEDNTGHYDKCPVCDYPSYNDLGHNHFCTVCGQRLEFDEEVGKEE